MTEQEIMYYFTTYVIPLVAFASGCIAMWRNTVGATKRAKKDIDSIVTPVATVVGLIKEECKKTNDKVDAVIAQNNELRAQNEALIKEISRIRGSRK